MAVGLGLDHTEAKILVWEERFRSSLDNWSEVADNLAGSGSLVGYLAHSWRFHIGIEAESVDTGGCIEAAWTGLPLKDF